VSDVGRRPAAESERAPSELAWDGPLSPPRKNGEIQFAELWESRVFGLTMSLYESGAFDWSEFQAALIEAIGAWERRSEAEPSEVEQGPPRAQSEGQQADRVAAGSGASGEGYRYWERWLEAFEALAARKKLIAPGVLQARVAELAARPEGWDHDEQGRSTGDATDVGPSRS
jgi:hypothetical protein